MNLVLAQPSTICASPYRPEKAAVNTGTRHQQVQDDGKLATLPPGRARNHHTSTVIARSDMKYEPGDPNVLPSSIGRKLIGRTQRLHHLSIFSRKIPGIKV
jgi:hypothetical protein